MDSSKLEQFKMMMDSRVGAFPDRTPRYEKEICTECDGEGIDAEGDKCISCDGSGEREYLV